MRAFKKYLFFSLIFFLNWKTFFGNLSLSEGFDFSITHSTSGDAAWEAVNDSTSYDSVDHARSGNIENSQSSALTLSANVSGNVSFYWKTSSQENYDFLRFYQNGKLIDSISGLNDWIRFEKFVFEGDQLSWVYTKDGFASLGEDRGFLDQFSIDHQNFTPEVFIPDNFKATTTFWNVVILTWEAKDGEQYEVFKGVSDNILESNLIYRGDQGSYNDYDVEHRVGYHYWIKTLFKGFESATSNPVRGIAGLSRPSLNLSNDKFHDRIGLKLYTSAGNLFQIFRSTDLDFENQNLVAEFSGNAIFEDTNVSPGITYYYRAFENDGFSLGPSSSIREASVPLTPIQVKGLIASDGDHLDKIDLIWEITPNTDSYTIYRGINGMNSQELFTQTGNTYSDYSVVLGHKYSYKVKAINTHGDGEFSLSNSGYIHDNSISLSEGLDYDGNWVLSDGDIWYGQDKDSIMGGDAIRSHEINYGTSEFGMTVNSDSVLRFHYKINSNLIQPSLKLIRNNYIINDFNTLNQWSEGSLIVSNGDQLIWRFSDYDSSGNSIFFLDNINLTNDFVELETPEITSVYSGSSSSLYFNWMAVEGALDYEIYRNTILDLASAEKISTIRYLTTFHDEEAPNGVLHYYWVRAKNPSFQSDFSDPIQAFRRSLPPTNVIASDGLYQDHVLITWDKLSHASFYDIYRNTSDSSLDRMKLITVNDNILIDNEVISNKSYYYWVAAGNSLTSTSTLSNSEAGFALAQHIDLSTSLDTVQIEWETSSNDNLAWFGQTIESSDGVDAAQSPQLVSSEESFVSTIAPFDGTLMFDWKLVNEYRTSLLDFYVNDVIQRSYPDSTRTWIREHYRIKKGDILKWATQNINSVALLDKVQFLDQLSAPLAPEIKNIEHKYDQIGLNITWNALDYAERYYVYRSDSPLYSDAIKIAETDELDHTDYGFLEKGVLYYYWVQASNSIGLSPISEIKSGIARLPATEHISAIVNQGHNRVDLNWVAVENATTYKIYRTTSHQGHSGNDLIAETSQTSFSDNLIVKDLIHYYFVEAKNDLTSGLYSDRVDVFLRSDTVSLEEALDDSKLVWESSPSHAWYGYDRESYDGIDSARTGYLKEQGELELSTTASSNGILSFHWNLDPGSIDYYRFYINDTYKGFTNQFHGWNEEVFYVHTGDHLKWVFENSSLNNNISDTAWLDSVSISDNIPVPQKTISIVKNTVDQKVKFDWTDMDYVYEYLIYRSETNSSDDAELIGNSRVDSFIDDSSNGDTLYYYWIVSSNPSGNSDFSSSIASNRSFGTPFRVESSQGIYASNVQLKWNSYYPNSKFVVTRAESIDGERIEIAEVQGTQFLDTHVTRGSTYYYWIQEANNHGGRGNFSHHTVGFATHNPDPPAGLTASDNLTSNTIQLSWSTTYDANQYHIYRKYRDEEFQFIDTTSQLSYVDTSIEQNTLYDYYVIAQNDHGRSIPSNIDSGYYLNEHISISEAFGTDNLIWETGGDFLWLGQSQNHLDGVPEVASGNIGLGKESYLQATANISGYLAFNYKVSLDINDKLQFFINDEVFILEKNDGIHEFPWTNLQFPIHQGDIFGWRIDKAHHEYSTESQTDNTVYLENLILASNLPSPESPLELTANSLNTAVQLNWSGVNLANTFDIYKRNLSTGDSWHRIDSVPAEQSNRYEDRLVSQGERYEYYVTAVNESGESSPSNSVESYRMFEAPTGLIASRSTYCDHVLVSWHHITGASNYLIYKSHLPYFRGEETLIATTENNSYIDDGDFVAFQYYYYLVKAANLNEGIEGGAISNATPGYPRVCSDNKVTINEAIDLNLFTWEKTGLGRFEGYAYHSYDGVDAAQISHVSLGETLEVTATASYPGELSFFMKLVEHETARSQKFTFYKNDIEVQQLLSFSDWVRVTVQISEGDRLNFAYHNPNSVSAYGLIDQMSFIHDTPVPEPPSNLTVSRTLNNTTLRLDWTPTEFSKSFHVYRSSDNQFTNASLVASDIEENRYYNHNLTRGVPYYYWVVAINVVGESNESESAFGVTSLPSPSNIETTQGSASNNIQVFWEPVNHASYYEVIRTTLDGQSNPTQSFIQVSGNSYLDEEVVSNSKYYYKVIPHNNFTSGDTSNSNLGFAYDNSIALSEASDTHLFEWRNSEKYPWSGQTYDTRQDDDALVSGLLLPGNSSIIESSSNISGNLSFMWNKHSRSEDDYRFYINDQLIASLGSTRSWNKIDVSISKGDQLKWVFTKNVEDLSFIAFRGVALLDHITFTPHVPVNLLATQDGFNSITLSWDEVEFARGYNIYRSENQSFSESILITNTINQSFDDNDIDPGREYFYRIEAYYNEDDPSPLSEQVKGITLLEAPTSISATDHYFNIIELSWDKQPHASGYRIYRGETSDTPILIAEVSDLTYTDSSVSHNRNYFYWVTAVNDFTESELSLVVQGALSNLPNTINSFAASYGTYQGNIQLYWDEPAGSEDYLIYRATSNIFNDAIQLHQASGNYFVDNNLLYDQPYFYWVRPQNTNGIGTLSHSVLGLADGLSIPYDEMLGGSHFTWSSGGNANWITQDYTSIDSIGAVQSGKISDGEKSYLQTVVPRNGQITFYWKISSENEVDFLQLYINEKAHSLISGETNWQKLTVEVEAGDQLKWVYEKNETHSSGDDFAWLDEVKFKAESPELVVGLISPTGLTLPSDSNHEFIVAVDSQDREVISFTMQIGYDEQKVSISSSDAENFSSENTFGTPEITHSANGIISFTKTVENGFKGDNLVLFKLPTKITALPGEQINFSFSSMFIETINEDGLIESLPVVYPTQTFITLQWKKGDVNGDGELTILDALLIAMYLEGIKVKSDLIGFDFGDINNDFSLDEDDIKYISDILSGRQTE